MKRAWGKQRWEKGVLVKDTGDGESISQKAEGITGNENLKRQNGVTTVCVKEGGREEWKLYLDHIISMWIFKSVEKKTNKTIE